MNIRNDETLRYILLQATSLCFIGSEAGNNLQLIAATDEFCMEIIKAGAILYLLPEWFAAPIIRRLFPVEKKPDRILDLLVPPLVKGSLRQKIPRYYDDDEHKEKGDDEDEEEEMSLASWVLNMTKPNGELNTPEEAALYYARISLSGGIAPAFATNFMIFEIARRPSLVKDVRREIEKLGINERTPEKISQIRLLDSILREIFRCKISSLGMFHRARTDATLATGETVPRGCMAVAALLDAHMDPTIMKKLQF